MKKYWRFKLDNPVDIAIACNYIDQHFPDRYGECVPAQDWSWFGKTAEQQIHYADRTYSRQIVFDSINKRWLLDGNITERMAKELNNLLKYESYWNWEYIAQYKGPARNIPADQLYEEHMGQARKECTISPVILSLVERTVKLELIEHNEEVNKYNNHQRQLRTERDDSNRRNWQGDVLPYYKKKGYN